MKPKKKSNSYLIISILILLTVAFLTIHFSMAYEWAISNPVLEIIYDGTTKEKFNIVGLFETFENSLKNPFSIYFTKYTFRFLLATCGFTLLLIMYIGSSKKNYISDVLYGSSKWGDIKEEISNLGYKKVRISLINETIADFRKNKKLLKRDKTLRRRQRKKLIKEKKLKAERKNAEIKKKTTKNSEIILADKVMFSIYNREINCNVLIWGGSGAGKTRGIVMPNILNLAGTCSFVITDPKGEIYQKSRFFLEKMGYKVRCLNLFEKNKTNHYNPFHYIHIERENYDWQEDVLTLIDTMIINLDGGEGRKSNDPFWDDAARHFIQSLFFFVMYMLKEEDRNMNSVMELLGMLELSEEEDDYSSPLDIAFQMLGERFGKENIAYKTYKDFRTKAAGKTAKSIAMTMVSKLQPYNIASMQALSDKDELLLDKIGEELTALFIIVPPVSKTFNFVAGETFQQMFQELNYCANALHGGRLPVPVQFIMDEFANTCIIPNFEQIIAYARSLGIGIMPILQSRAQLKGMYEKSWEVIIDNCSSTVYLGSIDSDDTLKSMSERLGKGTFDERDYSRSKGYHNSNITTSNKKVGRELMTPAEIAMLPKTDCLVLIKGKNPLYCKKYPYPSHRNYRYTSDFDDRYLTLFENVNNDEVTRREENTESNSKNLDNTINKITVEKDPSVIAHYMENSYLGGWNFVSDEYMIIEEGENDDIVWADSLEKEILESNKATEDIVNSVVKAHQKLDENKIHVTDNPEDVLNTLIDWSNNIAAVGFVPDEYMVIEEGEIIEDLYEDDNTEEEQLNDLLHETRDLKNEMEELIILQQSEVNLDSLFIKEEREEE